MNYSLKPIIDEKFWIVESNGQKYGTLRVVDDKLFELASNGKVNTLDKSSLLSSWGIDVENCKSNNTENIITTRTTDFKHVGELHGFPCASEPFNSIYDVKRKLPMYTKTEKSSSFHCAGYYVVKFDYGWTRAFCPKAITLQKYEYQGPFKSKEDMLTILRRESKRNNEYST